MPKPYREALNEMVTKQLQDLGKPQDWGVNNYEEVIQQEIKGAGGAREFAKSGTFPYEYSEIESFMKEHGQEPKADKYFDDLADVLNNFQDPEEKKHLKKRLIQLSLNLVLKNRPGRRFLKKNGKHMLNKNDNK